jgi:hypothetical protein
MRSDPLKKGINAAPQRALLKALGLCDAEIERPLIGVVSSQNDIVPGHVFLDKITDAVKQGVALGGGVPIVFPAIAVCDGLAMGHKGMKYSLVSRELIADSVEAMATAHPFDGLVMVAACDKNVPGLLMAAARLNIPSIVISGGAMLAGRACGRKLSYSDISEGVSRFRTGQIDAKTFLELENKSCPTCGSCSGMFTANSMNCLTEVLGMALPGNGTIPAVMSARYRLAKEAGLAVMELVRNNVCPRDIMTKEAFENALTVDMALGCSTNSMLHLPAIAHECGFELDLTEANAISARTPNLCHLAPAGHRYIEAVRDFYRLTGPTPLLPRFAMGNWWSRYYRYTQDGYLALMDRFKREGIPFTTSVIDMDWHRVDDVDPKYGSGWTGYSWNRELFPDPPAFLADLHRRGLRTTLNVHPRDGVRAFEDAYPEVAKRVGIDPATEENVEFDLTNPDFVDAYFDMHHRMEGEGVDFWWLDWQQGGVTRQKGLDPLWMLNHMHYLDSGRGGNWPLTFSRYAGPGSHRYPVGFSGDTIVTWESLAFQPQFTATASNIGYGWWSHDIGGHMFGYRNEELEARWYQLGAFSPINRLHSSNSPFSGKEPWNFNRDVSAAMVDALRLRHAMMPYLYTMNYRAAEAGRPLVEPMYWQNPDTPDAYEVPDEFRFGTELVVAPIVSPDDAAACRGRADAWLPQGEWFDFFDGRRYVSSDAAGRRLEVWRSLDRTPVFAKAGAIVPLQDVAESGEAINSIANPQALRVLVFPGADGSFVMREDRGTWGAPSADTAIAFTWGGADASPSAFTVAPVTGDTSAVPELRDWTVVFRGVAPVDAASGVRAWSGEAPVEATVAYDEATMSLTVSVTGISSAASLRIEIPGGLRIADNPVESDAMDLLLHAQMLYRTKELALQAVHKLGIGTIGALRTMNRGPRYANDFWITDMPDAVAGALEEILLRS